MKEAWWDFFWVDRFGVILQWVFTKPSDCAKTSFQLILASRFSFFQSAFFHCFLSEVFWLVVSNPLKNISQIGNLPQIGVKIKNI